MKIVVGVNTLTSIDQPVYSNHCQFWFRLGRSSSHEFILSNPRRMSIDTMRNITAKVAIENNADYVLFIDDDVLVPLNAIDMLLDCKADIAAGWTLIRGYPFKNMFFRFTDPEKRSLQNVEGPPFDYLRYHPCDAVGFSCALLRVDLLKKIDRPYFVTGAYNTEDIYFCLKAREAVPDCSIIINLECRTSHNLGTEYIDPLNKRAYSDYYEKTFPDLVSKIEEKPIEAIKEKERDLSYETVLREAVWG